MVSDPLMSWIQADWYTADATVRRRWILGGTASTSWGARLAKLWPSSHGSDQKSVLDLLPTTQMIKVQGLEKKLRWLDLSEFKKKLIKPVPAPLLKLS
jgi:hypothetical protein